MRTNNNISITTCLFGLQKNDFKGYSEWISQAIAQSKDEDLSTKVTRKVKEGKKTVMKEFRVWPTAYSKYHGGGTSRPPTCRPYYKQSSGDPTTYQAKLDIMDSKAGRDSAKYSAVVEVTVPLPAGQQYPGSLDVLRALKAACDGAREIRLQIYPCVDVYSIIF